jgi:hypothetical protein
MREAAPFVYGQFDEREWLRSGSIGKRLAAVKYLDWAQNVESYSRLLPMVFLERPFIQFHVLVTLDSMIDQLNPRQRWILKNLLALYRSGRSDSNREFWRQRMLRRLRA